MHGEVRTNNLQAVEVFVIRLFWLMHKTENRRRVKSVDRKKKRGLSKNKHVLNSDANRANQQATDNLSSCQFFNNKGLVIQTTREVPWLLKNPGFFNPQKQFAGNYSVPLFEKEGLGEILLDKSPFSKGGGEYLQ